MEEHLSDLLGLSAGELSEKSFISKSLRKPVERS